MRRCYRNGAHRTHPATHPEPYPEHMKKLAALAALPLALAACGDDKPKTVEVNGSMTLHAEVGDSSGIEDQTQYISGSNGTEAAKGDKCDGSGGFSDIQSGGQVTITDDGGKTMGLGNLSAGELQSDGNYGNDCRFTFTVKDVDPSAKYYKVKIGHRDGPTYTLDDLKKGPALTLGD